LGPQGFIEALRWTDPTLHLIVEPTPTLTIPPAKRWQAIQEIAEAVADLAVGFVVGITAP